MHVPSGWSTQKRTRAVRVKPEVGSRKKVRTMHEQPEPMSAHELAQNISEAIQQSAVGRLDDRLNIDTILSGVTYRDILLNMFNHDSRGSLNSAMEETPVVSKSYEEAFMRESMLADERPCVMGMECEGFFVSKDHRFPCTEFLLPGELRGEPRMCVLCCRKHTQKMFYDLLYGAPTMHMGVIQRYGVIVGVPSEYAYEATLIVPANGPVQSMPFPSVSYSRNNYTVIVRNAIRFVVQDKHMGFQPPSHT